MDKYTQPRKAENKVELDHTADKNSGETLEPAETSKFRDNGDDYNSEKKVVNPGHEEETFAADENLFGQGRTTLSKVKPAFENEPR